MERKLRLVGIVRVSTAHQAQMGTPARQRTSIKQVALAHGVDPDDIIWAEVSNVGGGDLEATPVWRRVIEPALYDPDTHVAVDAQDRLIRATDLAKDFTTLAILQKFEKKIYHPGGVLDLTDPNDLMLSIILAAVAGRERAEIRRKFWNGKEERRRNKECVYGEVTLPVGISYDKGSKSWGYTDEVWKVRQSFRLFVEEGVTNLSEIGRRCGGVQNSTVQGWLRNPIYKGTRVYDQKRGGPEVRNPDGTHGDRIKVPREEDEIIRVQIFSKEEQLVSNSTWNEAQRLLDTRIGASQVLRTKNSEVIPYSGFLWSGYEDSFSEASGPFCFKMGFEPEPEHIIYGHAQWSKTKEPRYICRCASTLGKKEGPKDRCHLRYFRAEELNMALDTLFEKMTSEPWFLEHLKAKESSRKDTSKEDKTRIEAELDRLYKEEKRLLRKFTKGKVSERIHDELAKELRDERTDLEKALAALEEMPVVVSEADLETAVKGLAFSRAWSTEEKRAWLVKHRVQIWLENDGISGLSLRLRSHTGQALPKFKCEGPFSWSDLVGYDITSTKARMHAQGLFRGGYVARELGLKNSDRLSYLVRKGVLPEPKGRKGLHRVWTAKEIDEARDALEAWKVAHDEAV